LSKSSGRNLADDEQIAVLKLLEMQRNTMLMYTSCGWFFDDICGIETVQIMNYASRAIQLAKEIDGKDLEPGYKDILEKAPTNLRDFANGKEAYEVLVKPNSIDLNRVGAHLALSSVFEQFPHKTDIYCYHAEIESYDRVDAGIQILATGRASVKSIVVLEKHLFDFAVLHFGDHNLISAVDARMSDEAFDDMQESLKAAFAKGNTTEVMRIMNIFFKGNHYSLWHLFKDQQRSILYELLKTTWQEIEASFRHIYEHNYTIMQIMKDMNIPLPRALSAPAEFILNKDLIKVIHDDGANLKQLRKLAEQATRLSIQLDEATLSFEASHKVNNLMRRFEKAPDDLKLLERIESMLQILLTIISKLDLQTAQNVFFALTKSTYPNLKQMADSGDKTAKKWVEHFKSLAQYLDVKVD
jgi:hypothetical protein